MTDIYTTPPITWTADTECDADALNTEIRDKFNNIITNVVDKTTVQNLYNKTLITSSLNNPQIQTIAELNAGVGVTIDGILLKDSLAVSGIIDENTAQTLANKTLTSPVINTPTGDLATPANTMTLTNKRITKRYVGDGTTNAVSINADVTDTYANYSLASNLTVSAPTGTPTMHQALLLNLMSTVTLTLAWDGIFREIDESLPTILTAGKVCYLGFLYNIVSETWDLMALKVQP